MAGKVYSKLSIPSLLLINILLSACIESTCYLKYPDMVSGELEKLVDKSLLTGEPCEPPCWYNITPGITSDNEALDIVSELDFINSDTIDLQRGSRGGVIVWQTIFSENQITNGNIAFDQKGIVYSVIVVLSYHITLKELIEVIGDPDGIMTRPHIQYNGSVHCMNVYVVWLDQGLAATAACLPISEEPLSLVEPHLLIRQVSYFPSASTMDEYITFHGGPTPQDKFIEWEGFEE